MKRFLCLLFLVAISLAFTSGCIKTTWTPTEHDNVNNFDGVYMIVKEETVSPTGLSVVIGNNSNSQCIYSEDFLLEKKIKGNWYQVPIIIEDYGFVDIGYELAPGEKGEWDVDWEWLYGSLDIGEYRIVKGILDFRGTGDFDKYILAAEFEILSDKE